MTLPLPRRQAREPLGPGALEFLHGESLFVTHFYIALGGDFDRAQQFWDQHRDAAVAEYVELHPGSRSAAWWRFSAPEPTRQRLGGTGNPHWHPGNLTCHGLPQDWRDSLVDHDPPIYESEAAFLKRHDLLLPGELRRIPRRDFEPVNLRVRGDKVVVCRA